MLRQKQKLHHSYSLPSRLTVVLALLTSLGGIGCEPTVDDSLERLLDGKIDREQLKHEFLLARERAVEPLLEAFNEDRFARVRGQLVDIMLSLTMRLEDPRIIDALGQHLTTDPDQQVRLAIAKGAHLYNLSDLAPALLGALKDANPKVRQYALAGLNAMATRLDSAQQQGLSQATQGLLQDPDAEVRLEANTLASSVIARWQTQAKQLQLKAQLAEAESLYYQAIDYAPASKQANYGLAWFYCETGQAERGYDLFRQHKLLLDVPRLDRPPLLDGVLDDKGWAAAARVDSLFKFFWDSPAWVPPVGITTRFLITYTDQALYIGFRGHDDHPDSIVAKLTERFDPTNDSQDNQGFWSDDIIELMLDTDLDRQSFVHMGINSRGVYADEFFSPRNNSNDERYRFAADVEIAAHIGADFWSLEIALPFGQLHVSKPQPGDVWGANLVRNYRGQQYLQWVRTYGNGLQAHDFGFLRFL